ncbi:hypothetical protein TTHERM_00565640 (macronuclear) [Tetrahymena thermophila SB210]|uniref:Uncharacterized protein n=1 Tax=Tetrahymena thermophila (strain SB210) TaxID=312017 RepID=I7M9I5_TETTS|nr:hypothetical protein TTHERM_00565640 [Tetrahymena thermophila SB210]EAS01819.2 hypothetical protein TTHERM_00565640 [Tetrahymena thermophila SB210]|eukprot:XP_001022064.2 hypothetical protein TTHERM_00565640 [Tetrahymena thermophila SB210]
MLSHNSSQNRMNSNYYQSEGANENNLFNGASQDQSFLSNNNNNIMSCNTNNCKPVSKILAPSHGKHSSLYEKNPGNLVQNQGIMRLPSIGQLSSTKALAINPLSPNEFGSLFDAENKFINSCSSAQQKKRMIRVQSKNKFPSDFFNENQDQFQQNNGNEEISLQSNCKFFQSPDNNFNSPSQQRMSNPQIQVNQLKLSQHSIQNSENSQSVKQFDVSVNSYSILSPRSNVDDAKKNSVQLQSPQNTQYFQRPFISAMGSRSIKSQNNQVQQQNTPLSQLKKEFQFNKNNFIEQQYDMQLSNQQNSNNINQTSKGSSAKQNVALNNQSASGSIKRLISAQLPSPMVSPSNTFRMLSPTEKHNRLLSPSSLQQTQKIQSRLILKANSQQENSEQKQNDSIQEININEIRSCTNDLSIPNSPKNVLIRQNSEKVQKCLEKTKSANSSNKKSEINTPKSQQSQKSLLHHPMSQQAQRPKIPTSSQKRTPNYDVKSSANIHEAINKGPLSTKNNEADKKNKLFQGSFKERKDTESSENSESQATKFISRKPVAVNKAKGGSNIDFSNFKVPISTINKKIKEISVLPNNQERQAGKSQTTIVSSSSKNHKEDQNQNKQVQNSEVQKKKKSKALSTTKLQSFIPLNQQESSSIAEVQIEEQIDDHQSLNAEEEHAKEEQTFFEGENSDTTKNSIQQNNTNSLNSPSLQYENLYLFSDKQIQSSQNSMVALPPPQLKQFYSDCCDTSNFNCQNTFSFPNQISVNNQDTINFQTKIDGYQQHINNQNLNQNFNNQYNQFNEFIEEHPMQQEEINSTNNYNRTANFTDYHSASQNENSQNQQKLKSSQKALPKIALNFKESEKYKPFLIRKVSSQCSMRVRGNLSSNSTCSNQSNNMGFDFMKNGSGGSTTNGKSMISSPTLLASNEHINSHEFSFSNQ